MGRIDDPTSGAWEEFDRRLAALESRVPLSDSAVSGGRTRFIGQKSFLIEGSGDVEGTLTITGVEIVDGELRIRGELNVTGPTRFEGDTDIAGTTSVSGRLDVTGPAAFDGDVDINGKATVTGDTTVTGPFHVDGEADFDGPLQVKGPTDIDGDTDINGKLGINGDTTVRGDVTVDAGGLIRVDDMVIGRLPGTTQAGINFGVGQLKSTGDRTVLQSGDAIVGVRSNQVALLFGALGIEVFSSGVYLQGVGFPPAGIQQFPVVTDSNGKLYRAPASN
ncbi:polymer-forming cytoskeletal protein [Curtobacterium sp. BRD11]|uniref:polymer-forming cytoskeletal protein n=1 Tax=Curtobacterium sp. BRD11 TaxID=2962581 RepID=UPI00288147FB|nr:polymer-forming cytoskeletal protein [Curtobacterium sp. BRD11]MDT0211248.1 polymer-forming cytoskeletal protein [Curtobacterium sp. BRD11]